MITMLLIIVLFVIMLMIIMLIIIMLMTRCKEIYEERGGTLTDKQICAGGEPGKVGDADNLL